MRFFVLDVSDATLERAKARLGTPQEHVTWIEAEVTGDWVVPTVDIWHDRAVFHFLTAASDRRQYVDHLRRAVKPGGAPPRANPTKPANGRMSRTLTCHARRD